ncbi:hypothetical protein PLICRDRAFT_280705 [Plicaturopsis crispa FD-325 SS-3]|nr:hypothetical protein PLICRDRAFT_280705 [Plicaturopsis crispa FD-325 SS-3]
MSQADVCSDDDALLANLQREAKELEETEDDLQKRLREVQQSRASVKTRIANLLNQKTPISRLPDDVLVDIFGYGDPTYTNVSLPSHVVASHVLQHWRQVILHAPLLWTCIWRGFGTGGYPIALLEAHLERSRDCPLNFIACGDESDDFFQALNAHVGRWSALEDTDFGDGDSHAVLRSADLCAPMLRRLSLAGGEHALLSEVGTAFPSLTVLRISSSCPLGVLQDALAQLPSLQTLVIDEFGPFDTRHADPVRMPSLSTLELGWATFNDEPDCLPGFLSAIRAPSLESLILRYIDETQVEPFEDWLESATSPVFPCLRRLTLDAVPATATIVHAFPGIEHVVLHVDPLTDYCDRYLSDLEEWLQPAAGDSATDVLWPLLQSVSIRARYYVKPYDPSLLVAARIAAGHPLQKVAMDVRILPSEDTIEWLKRRVQFEPLDPEPRLEESDNSSVGRSGRLTFFRSCGSDASASVGRKRCPECRARLWLPEKDYWVDTTWGADHLMYPAEEYPDSTDATE